MVDPERQAAIALAGSALQRYQRSTQSFDDAVGRAFGLGPADLRCLDHLSERPHSAGELATAAGLRPAATTALIDRLQGRGLVRRAPAVGDRRRIVIELTSEGGAMIADAYGPLAGEGAAVFHDIDTDAVRAIGALLDRMTEVTDHHRARVAGLGAPGGGGASRSAPSDERADGVTGDGGADV